MDGVDQLYAGSDRIDQSGRLLDVRLGATKQWAGQRTLELLLLHNRTDMTHDVHFTTWTWDQVARTGISAGREEHNGSHEQLRRSHSIFPQLA